MEVWIALVGGIIIGWLIEWLIDWQYWRRGLPALYANEERLRAALAQSEKEKNAALAASAAYSAQLDVLRSRHETWARTESGARRSLETTLRENAQLKEQLASMQSGIRSTGRAVPSHEDNLEKIVGIGQAYQQTLADAGVHTYDQLAALSVDELRALIRPAAWQNIDFAQWIREAQALAAQEARTPGAGTAA